MSGKVLYRSKSTFKSLWQEYRIYEDHVEFSTHFGIVTIPFDVIESVKVKESDVKGLFKGDLQLRDFKPALKIDWANFQEHVVLDKKKGFCKRFLFTPTNPQEFVEVLEKLLKEKGK
jgi:glutathione peroxidase-family protein